MLLYSFYRFVYVSIAFVFVEFICVIGCVLPAISKVRNAFILESSSLGTQSKVQQDLDLDVRLIILMWNGIFYSVPGGYFCRTHQACLKILNTCIK